MNLKTPPPLSVPDYLRDSSCGCCVSLEEEKEGRGSSAVLFVVSTKPGREFIIIIIIAII